MKTGTAEKPQVLAWPQCLRVLWFGVLGVGEGQIPLATPLKSPRRS